MLSKKTSKLILAVVLSLALVSSTLLMGCSALSQMTAETDSSGESTTAASLTNLLRQDGEYEGIEVLHGTWEEPCYSPDGKGYFYEERGWIYLHIEGEPAERGYQHGWLMADYIQRNIDHTTSMLAELQSLDWEYLRVNAERMWIDDVSEELKAEMEGIVAGAAERSASFDLLDLLVLNGLEELRDCWFPTMQESYYTELAQGLWNPQIVSVTATTEEEPAPGEENSTTSGEENSTTSGEENNGFTYSVLSGLTNITGSTATNGVETAESTTGSSVPLSITYTKQASALIATGSATEDGGIILAHNTIVAYADANFTNVMIDVDPSEGERFTMQAAPGFIHSSSEAYSTESLLVANTRINGFNRYNEEGTPEFLRIRNAVQKAKTLDDFTNAMLQGNNGGLASTWLVGEHATSEIMALELGLSFYNVEKLSDGVCVSFGGVDDTRILRYETDGTGYTDIRLGSGSRHIRLLKLSELNNGALTTDLAKDIIADHYDTYRSSSAASSRSICAHYTTDNAEYAAHEGIEAYMPYGTVDAKVMSSELAKDNTILARWGSACGKAFDSGGFLTNNPQYSALGGYLFDRPSEFWNTLYPISE